MAINFCTDSRISIYFAIDKSESMLWGTTDAVPIDGSPSRIEIVKAAMHDVLEQFKDAVSAGLTLDIAINFWATISTEESYLSATITNLTELQTFVADMTLGDQNTTDFDQAAQGAATWFGNTSAATIDRRIFIFLTDGEPAPAGTDDDAVITAADMLDQDSGVFNTADGTEVEMYGFNILLADTTYTARLDNTPSDGVPVLESLNSDELVTLLAVSALCVITHGGGYAVFFRLDTSPPLRIWCGINDVPVGFDVIDEEGAVYLGAGRLLDVPELEVLINGVADSVDISLPGVSVEMSNRIAAEAPNVQGLAVNIGICNLDDRYQPTSAIIPVWYGRADVWTLAQEPVENPTDQATRTLVLSVASGMTSRARPRRTSYTDAQQKLLYPTDDFCNRVSRYTKLYEVEWPIF